MHLEPFLRSLSSRETPTCRINSTIGLIDTGLFTYRIFFFVKSEMTPGGGGGDDERRGDGN